MAEDGSSICGRRDAGRWSRWLSAFALYTRPRVLVILLLGFSAGVPLFVTGRLLSAWMSEAGVSLGTIGLFAAVGTPYVFKFLWAPAIDAVRVPGLARLFGRRRAWLLVTQGALVVTILAMAGIDPVAAPFAMVIAALAVAFCSATQDIVIDAARIETLALDEQGAGMASYVGAYRVAMLVTGGGGLILAEVLQDSLGFGVGASWPVVYVACAALMGVGIAATLMMREDRVSDSEPSAPLSLTQTLRRTVYDPFHDFYLRYGLASALVIGFILIFKWPDAFLDSLFTPFILQSGFEKSDLAVIGQTYGLAATLVGAFLGGVVQARYSLLISLSAAAVLQMVSNLAYVWLAASPGDLWVLTAAVTVENVTGGFGTILFVAFLSALCGNPKFTATQFALLSAAASLPRVWLSLPAGYVAEGVGWESFFLISTVMGLPAILAIWLLYRVGTFRILQDSENAKALGQEADPEPAEGHKS